MSVATRLQATELRSSESELHQELDFSGDGGAHRARLELKVASKAGREEQRLRGKKIA
jgi:hypothetical protein